LNETPPVCDYEHSDYQTTFWDQGGREYEDAVEAVALRRLLPKSGSCLLELGAGAGRNTPRYAAFEHVVLVDYSRTQLEQAQQRLGRGPRYTYVAADIYRLPFAPARFDAATMIRTLHHMADARRALDQVRQALQPNAAFILEFANKQNLKAMLRYALGRQSWSPYSPEPVEFAPLNFDFHPATVRAWLRLCGFSVERQLTVSHYRMPFFKRLFPLRLLVWMDSMAQLSGAWWQVSPSVFVLARASAAGAAASVQPPAAGGLFRCPACGQDLPSAEEERDLICPRCGQVWPVRDGIYDFRGTSVFSTTQK
jgi:SAM-dependent methyltransferase